MNKKNLDKKSLYLIILLTGIVLISGTYLLSRLLEYKKGTDEYKELKILVQDPAADTSTVDSDMDTSDSGIISSETAEGDAIEYISKAGFQELSKINPDVTAWLEIPGTGISYPVVHTTDNTYYMNHTFKKNKNSAGAIFIETFNSGDFSNPNTVIYGHNMRNGSMFASLSKYKNKSFWEKNKTIYINTPAGNFQYTIFSCYSTTPTSSTYTLYSQHSTEYDVYLKALTALSIYPTGLNTSINDSIITLSTCESGVSKDRFVVHAKKVQ